MGLGRKLMGYLEAVRDAYGMDKIMLTVLKGKLNPFL
jgi:hypothetical protein